MLIVLVLISFSHGYSAILAAKLYRDSKEQYKPIVWLGMRNHMLEAFTFISSNHIPAWHDYIIGTRYTRRAEGL